VGGTSFEMLVFVGGDWRPRGSYERKEQALAEAMRLANDAKCLGVRVVSRTLDPERLGYVTRTIFRRSKAGADLGKFGKIEARIRQMVAQRRARA